MKASELESRGQGPSACIKSCEDIGMRMAALVLVGDTLPGCVCQPVQAQGAPSKPGAPETGDVSYQGAGASATGYVVLAAAAAAQQQQQDQQRRNQQQTPKY